MNTPYLICGQDLLLIGFVCFFFFAWRSGAELDLCIVEFSMAATERWDKERSKRWYIGRYKPGVGLANGKKMSQKKAVSERK